uniref:Uncharacterized protein n=1 Tax=Rhizophora mucronata TaxID=61149 RepID=A0A2P2NTC5_RHIMU
MTSGLNIEEPERQQFLLSHSKEASQCMRL